MKKLKVGLMLILLYLFFLVVVYYIHISNFNVDVVFYSALIDVIISTFGMAFLLFFSRLLDIFHVFEKIQFLIIFLLIGYSLAISVPTVIDRSLSFYILEKLTQRGGSIREDAFDKIFSDEYVKEHRLIDVRLTEQVISGTILIKDRCVMLTSKGKLISVFSRYFRQHWLPKKRLLLDKYTDDLIDPFKDSIVGVTYECGN
jgi:hypothetical protein